jgi:hypothetical protein
MSWISQRRGFLAVKKYNFSVEADRDCDWRSEILWREFNRDERSGGEPAVIFRYMRLERPKKKQMLLKKENTNWWKSNGHCEQGSALGRSAGSVFSDLEPTLNPSGVLE